MLAITSLSAVLDFGDTRGLHNLHHPIALRLAAMLHHNEPCLIRTPELKPQFDIHSLPPNTPTDSEWFRESCLRLQAMRLARRNAEHLGQPATGEQYRGRFLMESLGIVGVVQVQIKSHSRTPLFFRSKSLPRTKY